MWDDDDEYLEREPGLKVPLIPGILVILALSAVGLAIWWST
jgi:hypothetical protein